MPEAIAQEMVKAVSDIAKKAKIPGFRPGKAPYAVIQRSVGDAAILEQALDMLIDEIYPDVIQEADIHPYGPGRLDNVASMEPMVLEFIVPLEADVILGDYRSLRKPYEPEPVTEQAVDEALEGLRERQASVEPVDRPVQSEDIVTIRIGAHVKGNEDDILLRETSFPIVIRSKPEEEFPFQGFSKNLIGD